MTRLSPHDCLFDLFEELCTEATTLPWYDADARESWRMNCAQLLQAVPDPAQRLAWSMELAQHLAARTGTPMALSTWFLRKVE